MIAIRAARAQLDFEKARATWTRLDTGAVMIAPAASPKAVTCADTRDANLEKGTIEPA
jgi:hypothetical protein